MEPRVSIIIPAYNVSKYIFNMLTSIEKQSMSDFEAIIVNDGSTDNTQDIIDEFCKKDNRFKSFIKENGGVSSARNMGLDNAKGKYIVFWDPDDYVPEDSLEKQCNRAEKTDADMVISRYVVNKFSEKSTPTSLVTMSKRDEIPKNSLELVWVFSACNRLFKREIIEKHNLRFTDLNLGEDSIFWLQYMAYCNKIVGCDADVYEYDKRFALDDSYSLTQKTHKYEAGYFKKYISLLEECFKNLNENLDTEEDRYKMIKQRQELYKRLMRNNILSGGYRSIWTLSDEDMKEVFDAYNYVYSKLYDIDMENVKENESDLMLEKHLLTKDEVLNNIKISFVITRKLKKEYANRLIKSLYMQKYPYFEILIDEDLKNTVDERYLQKENCHFISGNSLGDVKNNAVNESKGKYITFFDEFMVPRENTYRSFFQKTEDRDTIVSIRYQIMENDIIKPYTDLDSGFKYLNKKFLKAIDTTFGNKVIKTKYIKDKKIKFTDDPSADIKRFYDGPITLKEKTGKLVLCDGNKKSLDIFNRLRRKNYSLNRKNLHTIV